jgi:hypothetical protein
LLRDQEREGAAAAIELEKIGTEKIERLIGLTIGRYPTALAKQ